MKDFFRLLASRKTLSYILAWKWVEILFNWVLTSGGTLSSITFLVAGIWLSVAKSVPDFISAYMNVDIANLLTYLSKTAFTALPEIILFLATLQVLDQVRMIRATGKGTLANGLAWLWAILYGIPTTVFVGFALFNIAFSLASKNYTMPDGIVIGRGLTCYLYALITFIYETKGRECFASLVQERESQIVELKALLAAKEQQFADALVEKDEEMMAALAEKDQILFAQKQESFLQITAKQNEIDNFLLELNREKSEKLRLAERASSLTSDKLSYYPKLQAFLENHGCKTMNTDSIVELTGHPKRRINKAIAEKALSLQSRNKEVLVSSLLKWLQDVPVPTIVIVEERNENDTEDSHSIATEEIEALPFSIAYSAG